MEHPAERRRFPRSSGCHTVAYTHYDGAGEVDDRGMARTLDVGGGGLLLEMLVSTPTNSRLALHMQVGDEILQFEARVVHEEALPNGHFRVGVMLVDAPVDALARLEEEVRATRALPSS